jgi:hypothetical protein
MGGKFKKLHVLLIGNLLGVSRLQQVVSDPKLTGRKHLFTVSVVPEETAEILAVDCFDRRSVG